MKTKKNKKHNERLTTEKSLDSSCRLDTNKKINGAHNRCKKSKA